MDKCTEIWRNVQGYEGIYEASSLGRVKSLDRYVKSNFDRTRLAKGSIKKASKKENGYRVVCLYKDNNKKMWYVHRLVALAFIPNFKNLPEVNHIDGDKNHNYVKNLEWVTDRDNQLHALKTGLVDKKKLGPRRKIIRAYSIDGSQLYEFDGMRDAERQLKISNGGVSHSIKHNQLCHGMKWEIVE